MFYCVEMYAGASVMAANSWHLLKHTIAIELLLTLEIIPMPLHSITLGEGLTVGLIFEGLPVPTSRELCFLLLSICSLMQGFQA